MFFIGKKSTIPSTCDAKIYIYITCVGTEDNGILYLGNPFGLYVNIAL